ncbi:hypothetical protein BJ170DRAFT_595869 [Xylariales sp. AK1849]|nr:hypothetical protein BJ170DRAFT_595869 [Xylariales sp. AK1849]
MAGSELKKGDKVSWNWGGGAPGGTVAEKKTEGEVAIKSKRGNTIKKNAEPGNPAVHVERSGNDVVKKASELTVESKASKNSGAKEQGEKRKASNQESEDDITEDQEDGKEVKRGAKQANKKRKAQEDEEHEDQSGDPLKDGISQPDNTKQPAREQQNGDKKKTIAKKKDEKKRSDKTDSKPKTDNRSKKQPPPRQQGDLVSTRTRSQAKE